MTFSPAVISSKSCVFWKVRARPARTTSRGLRPTISAPSKSTDPSSGRSNPVSALNSVDLPAPLGPMSALIVPS